MAGLIGLTSSDIELQDALGVARWEYEGDWIPHPVVRLTTTLPVAMVDDGERVARRATWGFPVGKGRPIGNARDDRLSESRMWSSMLGKTHCVVPATGIYEMINVDGSKQSFWFRRVDGKPILMPGLWGMRNVKDEPRLCCAIVTTEPNTFFGQYHDRQVCALPDDGLADWLAADPGQAFDLLAAPGVDAWEAVPVHGRIFKPGRVELEDLVATGRPRRIGDAPSGQQRLM